MDQANNTNTGCVSRTLAACCGSILACLSLTPLADTPVPEDPFTRGWHAFESGHYRTALDYWLPLAEQGDGEKLVEHIGSEGLGKDWNKAVEVTIDADQARMNAEKGHK